MSVNISKSELPSKTTVEDENKKTRQEGRKDQT